MVTPVKIRKKSAKQLIIQWSDGKVCTYSLAVLRRNCPCATCRADVESKGASYIPLFAGDALTLLKIIPMGHYALQFEWGDGHNTGIYNYQYLLDLCVDQS